MVVNGVAARQAGKLGLPAAARCGGLDERGFEVTPLPLSLCISMKGAVLKLALKPGFEVREKSYPYVLSVRRRAVCRLPLSAAPIHAPWTAVPNVPRIRRARDTGRARAQPLSAVAPKRRGPRGPKRRPCSQLFSSVSGAERLLSAH